MDALNLVIAFPVVAVFLVAVVVRAAVAIDRAVEKALDYGCGIDVENK